MTTQTEALKLALEALYFLPALSPAQNELQDAAIEAIKEALAQPEQEPVAADDFFKMIADRNPNPFHSPQRTWVGLSEEQKRQLNESLNLQGRFPIIEAIEAICKGNNT